MRIYIQSGATPIRNSLNEEEQGVQACARWPLTLTREAQRTPCSVASDGRLALGRPIHQPAAGSRKLDFATSRPPSQRLDGLSTNQPTHRAATPRLPVEGRFR